MKNLFINLKKLVNKINFGSKNYWETRYLKGGTSGPGSYGKLAEFKAEIINSFIEKNNISSVMEFGCGDGNQLDLLKIPEYHGYDVSAEAIKICSAKFSNDPTKTFENIDDYNLEKAELVLSLDVIFHLVENNVFENYMSRLFKAPKKYVLIYSSNSDDIDVKGSFHVKHRKFTSWIDHNIKDFKLVDEIENKFPFNGNDMESSFSSFFIYSRL